jgi:predicted anti-sigma-YlaC factor YlaD
MKTCEAYQEMISAYADNELGDAETSQMFFHLGECSECRTFMKSVGMLHNVLQENEMEKTSTRRSLRQRTFAVSYPVAAVIALVMLLSTSFVVMKFNAQPKIVEKTNTEYVYMSSYPTVYAVTAPSTDSKSN